MLGAVFHDALLGNPAHATVFVSPGIINSTGLSQVTVTSTAPLVRWEGA
jgi:hypothetical protein